MGRLVKMLNMKKVQASKSHCYAHTHQAASFEIAKEKCGTAASRLEMLKCASSFFFCQSDRGHLGDTMGDITHMRMVSVLTS